MRDSTLITTTAIGAVLAAICCAMPLLVVVLGGIGLTGPLAKADLRGDRGVDPSAGSSSDSTAAESAEDDPWMRMTSSS